MSKPIGFRLPLSLYHELEKRAEAKGESPANYVKRRMIVALAPSVGEVETAVARTDVRAGSDSG